MKPAAAIPGAIPPDPNKKSGTTIVKSAPPKETARITVKPNLPAAPTAVKVGNLPPKPAVAPAVAAVAGAAAVAATASAAKPPAPNKPATTIVKSGGTPPKAAAVVKPKASAPGAPKAAAVEVPVKQMVYKEEGSTWLHDSLAGATALLAWGAAGVLLASYFGAI